MKLKSPRVRFRESGHAKEHLDTVVKASIHAAFDSALLQIVEDQGMAVDASIAAKNQYRLEGAQLMKLTFLKLAEPDIEFASRATDQLPHPTL